MKKILLFTMLFLLASCSNQETQDSSNETETAEYPRVIKKIERVEFVASHEEAEMMQEEDIVDPENIHFELTFLEDPKISGVYENQIELKIEVEEDEELLLGSTHFRLEYYDGDEWEQVENVPYGAEDAQAIVTSGEPFEYTFYNVEQFETDFDTGVYRFVNSGYTFPFYIYVLN